MGCGFSCWEVKLREKKKKSWKPGSQGTKWGELKADDGLLVYHLDIQSRAPYAMAQNSSIFRDHFPVFFIDFNRTIL